MKGEKGVEDRVFRKDERVDVNRGRESGEKERE